MKALAAAVAAAAVLTACGSAGGGAASGQPAGSIKVTLTEYSFNPSNISAPSGKVVFYLVNAGSASHDMIITDSSKNRVAGSDLISSGDAFVFTVDSIAAGTYTFYCDQTGHEAAGMKGTLTVT
ncbi:MAG TPA: cupredoxin domain-containing protein [Candidatus Baltobacterales bacterium]|nr:cupredoxin domain-containing protein [Candidatus Baltobacterales bacterium]